MEKSKNIAALLTVHNRKIATISCLRELFKQENHSGYNLDVFLVDDGCTDGTPDAIREEFPDVNIIKGNGNLFWNRGMHTAWVNASNAKKYDFYFWLNDDTFLYKNALDVLILSSSKFDDKCVIAGTTSAVGSPEKKTYGGYSKAYGLLEPNGKEVACECFNGNIVLVPQFAYDIVGENDSFFHHALGDFDYGLRANKLGVHSYIAPTILGECDINNRSSYEWCNPQNSLRKRIKILRSPFGHNPEEFFLYDRRHKGFFIACFHYITVHIRVLFPWIWNI